MIQMKHIRNISPEQGVQIFVNSGLNDQKFMCVCVCGWNEFLTDNNSEVWLVLISNKEAVGRLVDPTGPILQMS
jgi:hypothetical protein